ncbi:MAG: hypothetical protein RIR79_1479 [Pseudomonadota bacterium]|jgi:predicted ATPase
MISEEAKKEAAIQREIGAAAFANDTQKALEAYRRATELDPDNADGWNELGSLLLQTGEPDKAISTYQTVLRLGQEHKNQQEIAIACVNLSNAYLDHGDLNKVEEYSNQSLKIFESMGHKEGMAMNYANLGTAHKIHGNLDKAVAYYNKSLEIFESIGNKEGVLAISFNKKNVYRKRERFLTELYIKNYKSVRELKLNVGRINFLIGENGCGKSNILEALTFASSAEADKLDNEFLASRGIRITEPQLMRSAFEEEYIDEDIEIKLTLCSPKEKNSNKTLYLLRNENKPYSKWRNVNSSTENSSIADFIIYSPENSSLRNLEKEGQIQPLGIYGEGLFKLLSVTQEEEPEAFEEIVHALELFGWYESIGIPKDSSTLNRRITLKDYYLKLPFDQRSANEGFLLVLFYITLVVSKYTPKIFAIDNIDTSLNPKLCTKLIQELTRLVKKYDKQVFVTSHNPAILDGIDLGDEDQRLIVVSRNREGQTECETLSPQDKPKSSTKARLLKLFKGDDAILQKIEEKFNTSEEPIKLSEAFLRGYLGGLPTGF